MAPQRWWIEGAGVAPCRRSDIDANELDQEVVLFDPRDGNTYHFNKTAYSVWCHCDGTTSVEEIAGMLTEQYDTSDEMAADHVDQLTSLFDEMGLLEPEVNG